MSIYSLFSLLITSFVVVVGGTEPPTCISETLDPSRDFGDFVKHHGKTYTTIHEYFHRKDVFESNRKLINNHNDENLDFTMAMNTYGDLTWPEFRASYLSAGGALRRSNNSEFVAQYPEDADLPVSFDWGVTQAVTSVKNQGACGSCWAFSTTGALEGLDYIITGSTTELSEQQLIDCSRLNSGCNGGDMRLAMKYASRAGVCSSNEYPYTSGDTSKEGTCQIRSCTPVFQPYGFREVPRSNETALQLALYRQPISIAIEADSPVFQFYSTGVMTSKACGKNLNHGVLLTGWGVSDENKYWKVKNSWGVSWGDKGYILLERNIKDKDGQCGLAIEPSYPVV